MGKKVIILMSTFNGGDYLEEQLDSLVKQTYENISIIIRDDGSTDRTIQILMDYSEKYENITFITGENLGVIKSFFYLLEEYGKSADFISFCDQDDVWLPDKIKVAVNILNEDKCTPQLYATPVQLVDKNLNHMQVKKFKKIGKRNAIIQNVVTGCSVVINRNFSDLLIKNKPNIEKIEMHDSWMYLVCMFFGEFIYDDVSYIKYRQHENNVVGIPSNKIDMLVQSFKNLKKEIDMQIHRQQTLEFYEVFKSELSIVDKKKIERFLFAQNFFERIKALIIVRPYKQTFFKSLIFYICYIFKLI